MKKIIFLTLIIILPLSFSSCSLLGSSSEKPGGIYKSFDYGDSWESTNVFQDSSETTQDISSLLVTKIKIHPQDHKYVYLASSNAGLWYSTNAGKSWQQIFSSGNIFDFDLDPFNNGVVYASLGNKVYKTINLGENWEPIYSESRSQVLINNLVVDPQNNLVVYLGTSAGELIRTTDGGESWQTITTIDKAKIKKILINPKNNNLIYLAAEKKGIFKSRDQGNTWTNLQDNYYDRDDRDLRKKFRGIDTLYDLIFDLTQSDALIYASNYGLLKSNDGGSTWQEINILTPPTSVIINSLAINPQDNSQIYYAAGDTLYRTFDTGNTWVNSPLLSSWSATAITVDYHTPNVIYLGFAELK